MNKNKIICIGTGVIGVALILLGVMGGMALPPILSGVGFLMVAWHLC